MPFGLVSCNGQLVVEPFGLVGDGGPIVSTDAGTVEVQVMVGDETPLGGVGEGAADAVPAGPGGGLVVEVVSS